MRARSARPTRCTSTCEAARAAGHTDSWRRRCSRSVYSAPIRARGPTRPGDRAGLRDARAGAQEFRWGPLVIAGDEIETTTTVKDIHERHGLGYYIFESSSKNQRGEEVSRGTWTNIVRERERWRA